MSVCRITLHYIVNLCVVTLLRYSSGSLYYLLQVLKRQSLTTVATKCAPLLVHPSKTIRINCYYCYVYGCCCYYHCWYAY